MNKKINNDKENDEIDLIEVLSTLWKGKWKIVLTILIVLGLGLITFYLVPRSFVTTVKIKPINSIQKSRYLLFNELNIYKIEASNLQKMYVEILLNKQLIENIFDKYQLLNSNQFDTPEKYKEELRKLVDGVNIQQSKISNNKDKVSSIDWELTFKYIDESKWKNVLAVLDKEATEKTRQEIIKQFNLTIEALVYKKNKAVDKLDEKAENLLESHRSKKANKLAFLEEQAAIAKKLKIKNNTIESQNFNSSNGVITTIKTESSFYLRGYDAIEEEIKLIKSRKNDRLFVADLVALSQEKKELLQNNLVNESKTLFKQTPVVTNDDFRAVQSFKYLTKIKYKYSLFVIVFLLLVLGGIMGFLWVLISSAIRKRNSNKS